jgi:succinate dehydrogenase flavin-adding protein (antitoxin of CptAB toxin-antitoxin module)
LEYVSHSFFQFGQTTAGATVELRENFFTICFAHVNNSEYVEDAQSILLSLLQVEGEKLLKWIVESDDPGNRFEGAGLQSLIDCLKRPKA